MNPVFRTSLAVLACFLLSGAAGAAAPRYDVLPYQPAGSFTRMADLNDLGHTAGRYLIYYPELGNGRMASFLSFGASYVDLAAQGVHVEPAALNNRGQLVGTRRHEASGQVQSYFYTGSQVREIASLGGHATVVTAVNDSGQAAGYSALTGWDYRAFIYQDGVTTPIGSPGGPDRTSGAFDINQRGQVVGEWVDEQLRKRAFFYDGAVMTDLGTLGGNAARATDISNAGHVLGWSETAAGTMRSFLWFNGSMSELSTASGSWFGANGVNSAGDVVGGAGGDGYVRRGGVLYKLNDTLEPGSGAGWGVSDAIAINDKGQIAAYGCKDGFGCTALLLSPVPEAGMAAMLLAGLALGALFARRRAARRRPLPGPWSWRCRAAILLALGAGGSAGAWAATPLSFTVTTFPVPPGMSYGVADLNNAGQLAGEYGPPQGNLHAFLQTGQHVVDLGTLGGWGSSVRDLNNAGAVTGRFDAPVSGSPRGFLYAGGTMRDLGTLGGDYTYVSAMNDAGHVVGYSHTLSGQEHAFLYVGGSMTDLGTLASHGNLSYASDINNAGQVTGHWIDQQGYQRAFIHEAGVMRDLGTLGGRWSYGTGINDAGHIIGMAETSGGGIGGFIRRGGYLSELGSLGGGISQAIDINNAGDVIGMAYGPYSGPFIWRDGVIGALNDYLVPGSGLAIADVARINDKGQILATGCRSGGCVQVVLTPVPEPAAAALLAAGLLVLLRHTRRVRAARRRA